jgi:hypothetical protein
MTSTTNTAVLPSCDPYLKSLGELDEEELEAERAKINGRFFKSAREVDGRTIRELRPTDFEPFSQWCDTNYIQQQKTPKTLVSNSEGSARKVVSQGAGDSFEACDDI